MDERDDPRRRHENSGVDPEPSHAPVECLNPIFRLTVTSLVHCQTRISPMLMR
jgi:hypothetical protein